jgi:hypothetical protein
MDKQLTSKLFIPILILSLLTFGFSFIRFVFEKNNGVNCYLILFIGFLITIFGVFIMKSLIVQYPDQSLIRLGNKLLGPFGKIGGLLWLLLIFLLVAVLIRRVTDEVATIILFRTPGLVSILAYYLIALYMASLGEEALGRLASVLLIASPVFLVLLFLSFREVSFLNIHPVNIYRDWEYLQKWDRWLIVFTPVWIVSVCWGHESIRNRFRTVILAITGGTLVLIATALAIAGAFGPRGMERYEWPVMSLINISEFASSYFFQNFLTTGYFLIFLMLSFVTAAGLLMVVTKGLSELLGVKNNQSKPLLWVITAGLFGVTTLPSLIHFKETTGILLKAASLYIPIYVCLIWVGSRWLRKDH